MTAYVKLTFGGEDYIVKCQGVQVAFTANTTAKPKVNAGSVTEVQTHGFENPLYTLQGVQLTEESSTLTYGAILSMAKNKYDGTNGITLTVNYGVSADKLLVASDGVTTAIPVVVKSFNFPIPVADIYEGASRFHLPVLSITLQETA